MFGNAKHEWTLLPDQVSDKHKSDSNDPHRNHSCFHPYKRHVFSRSTHTDACPAGVS